MSSDFLPINTPGSADFAMPRVESLRRQAEQLQTDGLPDEARNAEMRKAAEGFESIFVHMLMKSMKTAMLEQDENNEGAMSFGGAALDGYVDLQFAEYATDQGGFGLAEQIYAQMSGGGRIPLRTQTQLPISQRQPVAPSADGTSNEQNDMIKDVAAMANSALQMVEATKRTGSTGGNSFLDRVIDRIRPYESQIRQAAAEHSVPASLVKAVIAAESAGQANAVSPAGAKGLMQLMDGTASDMGVDNSMDPSSNIKGGTRYLGKMLARFDGDLTKALAAYNAGPGNVDKYKGVPPFAETRAYVSNVQRYHEMFAILENTAISGSLFQNGGTATLDPRGFPL